MTFPLELPLGRLLAVVDTADDCDDCDCARARRACLSWQRLPDGSRWIEVRLLGLLLGLYLG